MSDECTDCGNGKNGDGSVEAAARDVVNAVAEFTEAVALIQAAVAEIDTKKVEAIADIETQKQLALIAIQGKKTEVEKIHATVASILSQIQALVDPFLALFRQGE